MKTAYNIPIQQLIHTLKEIYRNGYRHINVTIEDDNTIHLDGTYPELPPPPPNNNIDDDNIINYI